MEEGKALLIGGVDGVLDFVQSDFEGFELAPLQLSVERQLEKGFQFSLGNSQEA